MEKGNILSEMNPLAGGMLMIHKIISRGLNTSIRKCDEYLEKKGIPVEEIKGFSLYITTLKWVTHSHHLSEDDIVFPYFRDSLAAPYDQLKEDHNNMVRILEKINQSLSELSSGGVGKLREALGEFDRLWGPHIKIEEEYFTDTKVKAAIGPKDQDIILEKLEQHGMNNSGPGPLTLPFIFYSLENTEREVFMKSIPWFVKKILVPVIWRRAWKPMSPFLLN